jgi:uncharacterized integral membrane protein
VFFKEQEDFMKTIIKAIITILVMLLAIIIIIQNLQELSKTLTLKVDFLFWAHETPQMAMYLVIIMAFLLGIFTAGFIGIVERFNLKKRIRILSRENMEKDKELNSYRNLPIVEDKIEDKGLGERD